MTLMTLMTKVVSVKDIHVFDGPHASAISSSLSVRSNIILHMRHKSCLTLRNSINGGWLCEQKLPFFFTAPLL